MTRARSEWPADAPIEIVERKGLGHPDTLCDAIAERVCIALCRNYRERFGMILHHNVDKVLLVGGASRPAFGGGEVIGPIEIYLAGRATAEWRGIEVPVAQIAIAACREAVAERLPLAIVDRDVRVFSRIRPGSGDLTSLFAAAGVPRANDTSIGVGFAPRTKLEQGVLAIEPALVASKRPEIGPDVKVMGVRRDRDVDLTVACAFVDRHVASRDAYDEKKARAEQLVRGAFGGPCSVVVNAGDVAAGAAYLTVIGSSAEAGDDGEVGRGNRATGLITPCRPMTMEATAGKNPVNHVGKLYSVIAERIAATIIATMPDLHQASCFLVSKIGARIDEPALADIAVGHEPDAAERAAIDEIVHGQLASYERLQDELIAGRITLF